MSAINAIINNTDTIILNYVQGAFGTLSPIIGTLWTSMFIVFIAIYGYKVVISGRFGTKDLLTHCFRIIAVLVIATSWNEFFIFVYDLTTTFPSDIAGQILAGTTTSIGGATTAGDIASANTALGSFYERGSEASSKIIEAAGWSDIGLFFYSFAVWFATIGLAGYAMMLIILSKLAMGILLAVGPFFILMLVFGQTKTLFEGWLRTLLNYSFIPVFVYALLALLLALLEDPTQTLVDNADNFDFLVSAIGPFLLICVISILLLAQIMNLAAGVTGGLSLSTMGSFKAVVGDRTVRGAKITSSYIRYRGEQIAQYSGNKVVDASRTLSKIAANLKKNREVR